MLPALIALVLILMTCLFFSVPLTRRHELHDPHSPVEYDLVFEEVHFASKDGIPLKGWWIPAPGSNRTVIFLHGFSGSMDPDLKYAPLFHQHGFNILMFDFRGHGRSGGDHTSLGALEVSDVFGAVTFARARESRAIGLLGFSMGGRTALMSAAKGAVVQAVISDGGPLCLRTAIQADLQRRKIPAAAAWTLAVMILIGGSMRLGVNLFTRNPLYVASQIEKLPVLLIHGGKDPYTKPQELEKIASDNPNLRVWTVEAAGHREVDELEPERYAQRVISFFEENLKD